MQRVGTCGAYAQVSNEEQILPIPSASKGRVMDETNPYRNPAEMPQEEEYLMELRIIRWVIMGVLSVFAMGFGTCVANTWHATNMANGPNEVAKAQADAITAKAQADKAMWDKMKAP
jgi:hypothetical protein